MVQNCRIETAEKVLKIIDGRETDETLDQATHNRLKYFLSQDEVTGKAIPEWQASK